ncbi:hypothetical protein BJ944DRAFT_244704 [Cunninghamella echinulata]|nr:hypothetical protein BJ944DRAFT_244704 [Cunninghamella echinulata]
MSNSRGTLYNTSALKRKEPPTSISSPSKRQKLIKPHPHSPSCLLSPFPFILPLHTLLSSHSSPSSPLKSFSISPSLSPPPSPTLTPSYSPFSSPLHSPLLSSSPLLLPLPCSPSSSPPSPLLSFSPSSSTLLSPSSPSSFSSTTTPTKNKRFFDKVFSSSSSSTTTVVALPVLPSMCTIEKRKIIERITGREFLKKLGEQQIEMLESLVEKVSSEVVDDDATDIEDDDDYTTLPILLNSVVNTGVGRKNGNTSHDLKLFKYIREAIEYQDDYKDNDDNCIISTPTSDFAFVSTSNSTFTSRKIYKRVEFVLPEEEEKKKSKKTKTERK